jgi:CRISP-associated protein Cas1
MTTAFLSETTRRCPRCRHDFIPRKKQQRFCSSTCSAGNGYDTVSRLRAEGHDPLHGGQAAEKRRDSLVKRRAAGELLGKQLRNVRLAGLAASASGHGTVPGSEQAASVPSQPHLSVAPSEPPTPPRHAEPFDEERVGQEWLQAGMRYEHMAAKLLAADRGETLVLAGYGAGLRVERGALIVTEGRTHSAQSPTVHRLYRGMHGVKRIIVLGGVGTAGSLTFDALHWCTQQEIAISVLTRDGGLESCLTPEALADAKLRRRQYAALDNGQAGVIVRELVRHKLAGQQATLAAHSELPGQAQALATFRDWCQWLDMPNPPAWQHNIDQLRIFEGRLAQVYFAAWVGWPLRWAKADARRVPTHWLVARTRQSPLSWNGKRAVDPCNAVLNYAYGCLEGQCRQALTVLGFDVTCGFLHTDKDGRDSLVYDLMELERPAVDGLVLDFLTRTMLHYGDCTAVTDGSCRLHPQFARAVVASCRVPYERLVEHAERLASQLLSAPAERPATNAEMRRGMTTG